MSVTVADWPEGVPECIFPLSPQGGLRDTRLSFETDSRLPPIERPAASWAPEVYVVDLVSLTITQFQVFQAWYRNTLAYGSLPFKLDHPITRARMAWKIVKDDPPYRVTKTRLIRPGAATRGIGITFSIMSQALSFDPDFMRQENGDLVQQENGDLIILRDGHDFDPEAA